MLVIIGCGNLNRTDDGAGVIAIRRLLARHPAQQGEVRIFDAGTNGMEILFAARGARKLIVIDACRSGSEPGAIFEVPGAELAQRPVPSYTLHDFRWDHALYAGQQIWGQDFPTDVQVFLIEAASLDYGLDLTPLISRSVDRVVARVSELISAYAIQEPAS